MVHIHKCACVCAGVCAQYNSIGQREPQIKFSLQFPLKLLIVCVSISLLLTSQYRPRLNTFGGSVYSVWEEGRRTGSVLSDGNLPERPWRLMETLLNEGRRGFKWAVTRKDGARALFQCICCCASMCQSTCGSGGGWAGGNRWEVCHVLVNKSVIVLFCPAWLTVSCVGSTPFPLTPEL